MSATNRAVSGSDRHRFGSSPIPVLKLIDQPGRHDLREVAVMVECAWADGTESHGLSHQTLVETVYAIAKDHPLDQIEEFGLSLNDYLLMAHPALAQLDIELRECPWRRLDVGGQPQHHAFARVGEDTRVARVIGRRDGTTVEAGMEQLRLLRAGVAGSANAPPFGTDVTARWRYVRPDVSFGLAAQGVRQILLETFVEHPVDDPGALIQAMADAVLHSIDDVTEITLRLQLRPHGLVDLSSMGLTNEQGIFAPLVGPTEEVQATCVRATRDHTGRGVIMNRRQFLETATVTAAFAGWSRPTNAQSSDDPLGVRGDFPVTDEGVYLNAPYITPSPRTATAAVRRFNEAKARRPVSLGAMLEQKESVRSQFARLVGASSDEVGFLSATSDGENVMARALDLKPGDNVVLDDLHFSTSYILYSQLARTLGIELRIAQSRDGVVPMEAFEPLVDDRTRLISVAWVSHQNGFLHDVDGLAALAHAHGAYLYADAIQAAGMVPIDVRRTPIDCFACGTYKWLLGGFGIAPFFVRRSVLDAVPADRTGFLQMERDLGNHQYELFTTAKKFEYATPAFGAFYELGAGLDYLERVGIDRIHAHGVTLAHRMRRGLADLGVAPVTPEGNQTAIVAFINPGDESTAAGVFDEAGIQVTFRESGRQIRMGAALFNTEADIDHLLEAVERLT